MTDDDGQETTPVRVAAQYRAGKSIRMIAAAEGLSTRQIQKMLRDQKVTMRYPGGAYQPVDSEPAIAARKRLLWKILPLRAAGVSVRNISIILRTSDKRVARALDEAGIPRRRHSKPIDQEERARLRAHASSLYRSGLSVRLVGERIGYSYTHTNLLLHESGDLPLKPGERRHDKSSRKGEQ